jgi:hypothetical protein
VRPSIGREQEVELIDVLREILELEGMLKISPRPIKAGFCLGRNHQVWANWGLKAGGKCDTMNVR